MLVFCYCECCDCYAMVLTYSQSLISKVQGLSLIAKALQVGSGFRLTSGFGANLLAPTPPREIGNIYFFPFCWYYFFPF